MQYLNLFILTVALSSATACKYFCKVPNTSKYECCDEGNPYFNPDEVTEEVVEVSSAEDSTEAGNVEGIEISAANAPTQPPSNCYYYCAYAGEVYCCGDTSMPIPESHAAHEGACPEEDDQVCKNTGVFYISEKYSGKTNGALRLVNGPGKEQPACASDGYCAKDEKCCPSKCGRKHICMKSIEEDEA